MSTQSNQPEIPPPSGRRGHFGEQLGLTQGLGGARHQARRQLRRVFERNLGRSSRIGIARGLNRLWTKGGIQYAPADPVNG